MFSLLLSAVGCGLAALTIRLAQGLAARLFILLLVALMPFAAFLWGALYSTDDRC